MITSGKFGIELFLLLCIWIDRESIRFAYSSFAIAITNNVKFSYVFRFLAVVSSSPVTPTSTVGTFTSSSSLPPPSSSLAAVTSNNQARNSRDEIYIDDEGLEGSGGRGEVSISLYFLPSVFATMFFFSFEYHACQVILHKYKYMN